MISLHFANICVVLIHLMFRILLNFVKKPHTHLGSNSFFRKVILVVKILFIFFLTEANGL